MNKFLILILSSLFFSGWVNAQNITVELSVQSTQVSIDETFNLVLTFTNANNAEALEGPDLSAFNVYGEPSRSNNSSISIINGKTTRIQNLTFTYKLKAKKTGKFKIGPATAKRGQSFKSNIITVDVVEASAKSNVASNNKKMFVRAELNKKNVIVGEPVVVSYKIYLKDQVGGHQQTEKIEIPDNPGFWKEKVEFDQQWVVKLINGVRYKIVEVERHLLFPQKSGELEIGSFEFTGVFGSMGWFNRTQERLSSTSSPIKITVEPLPKGKPANFLGTFENLSLNIKSSPKKLQANKAIDFKATFEGKGNMKLINSYEPEFPSDFEAYDPKMKDNISVGKYFVSGRRTYEYIIIPRSPGEFVIPGKTYSYYNFKEKKYKYLNAPEQKFSILPGAADSNQNYTFNSKNDVNVLGQDIRFIKTGNTDLKGKDQQFFGSKSHYALMGFPVVLFFGFFAFQKRQESINRNPLAYKMNRAGKMANKHLSKAKSLVNQNKTAEFYEAISTALFGYLKDKFGISMSEMNKDKIRSMLVSKEINVSTIDKLMATLETCEIARYAPISGTSEGEMLERAEVVIREVEGS